MAVNILDAKRYYSVGGEYNSPTLEELKKRSIKDTLKIKPILARGHFDHLIKFKDESNPPIVEWKVELLGELTLYQLYEVRTICEKVEELQKRMY